MRRYTVFYMTIALILSLIVIGIKSTFVEATANIEAGNLELKVNVLGLESSGDCIIIQYGDIEILVDTSQTPNSFDNINDRITDIMNADNGNVWDYMIFTHPDKDHIGNVEAVLDKFYDSNGWSIGNIIDFDMSKAPVNAFNSEAEKYRNKRDYLVSTYGIDYFPVSELNQNNKTKTYTLGDDCELVFLYNYYDDYSVASQYKKANGEFDHRNDLSVCFIIKYKDQKLLFTGDLEEAGEAELIRNHRELLENVTFYKASHHGSVNANSDDFLDVIRPEIVSITKMNSESRVFERFFKYTDYIYPTYVKYDLYNGSDDYKMYGDELFVFSENGIDITMERNDTYIDSEYPSILDAKIYFAGGELVWYQKEVERQRFNDKIYVYILEEDKPEYSNCSLVKYGHYDILIDCGSSDISSRNYVEKLKKYVRDNKIEYVIVSHYHLQSYSQLINNGVFDRFEIGTLIDNANTNFKPEERKSPYYSEYVESANKYNRISLNSKDNRIFSVLSNKNFYINVIGSFNMYPQTDENNYSLITVVRFGNKKMMFVGDLVNYEGINQQEIDNIKNVDFLRLSGSSITIGLMQGFDDFIAMTSPHFMAMGSPLGYIMPNGRPYMGDISRNELLHCVKNIKKSNIFFTGYVQNNGNNKYYVPVNGDLEYCFNVTKDNQDYIKGSRVDKAVPIEGNY